MRADVLLTTFIIYWVVITLVFVVSYHNTSIKNYRLNGGNP
jgi:hypothetical protein